MSRTNAIPSINNQLAFGICVMVLSSFIGLLLWKIQIGMGNDAHVQKPNWLKLDMPGGRLPPVTENELVFPGASLVELDPDSSSLWKHKIYRTSASPAEVLDFYKNHLPQNKWIMVDDSNSPVFVRLEGTGEVSWKLSLNIALEAFENRDTGIHLMLGRWPDTTNIPLYKHADVVQSFDSEDADRGTQTKTTVLVTSDSPDQVDDFYKMTLPEYAWRIFDDVGIQSTGGVTFGYDDKDYYPVLNIVAREEETGLTRIELKLVQSKD